MKGRDLAILAAVVLLGGFALADTLRSGGEEPSARSTQTVPEGRSGPEPRPDAPEDWPAGRLRGTLVFTDARDCRVRVIGLGGGRERPAGELFGFCGLWAAPIGQRIAYSTGGVRGSSGESFAVVDLRRAGVELASIQNISSGGAVLWSPDARRVAWCTPNGVGQELELGTERPSSFARCPIAYTPDGQLAFAVGRRLVMGGQTVLKEREPILQAHWGADDSLLVRLAGGAVRRYAGAGGRVGVSELPLGAVGDLIPSPNNCAVLYKDLALVQVADVGCSGVQAQSFNGFDAAWSPDGRWLALADPDEIVFQQIVGGDERIAWPARARELYWRGD